MINIMGFVQWIKTRNKVVNRLVLVGVIVFDSYLAMMIYSPINVRPLAQNLDERPAIATPTAIPTVIPSATPAPSPSLATPTATPNTSPTPNPSSSSPAPTMTPSTTVVASPTPTPIPSPVTSSTPVPSTTTSSASSVYIKGYVYANNQQLVAEQYPVKVINTETSEVIASGETNHEGKSPTWSIPAGTSIRVTLYPKKGMLGCGDEWSLTIGGLGTTETHDLSIQADRTPCIVL